MLNKIKNLLKNISLKILFVLTYFIFMFITMFLMVIGTHIISYFFKTHISAGRVPLLTFVITSILVGTLVSFIFSKIPIRPIEILIDGIDSLAKGDFSARIYLRGPDVFKKLTNRFNHMAHELESTEMLRSDFINNFSHEFKTPIVSIRGFTKMMKSESLSEAQKAEYLDIIINESERLSDLSTNILNLSNLEHLHILTNQSTFNLAEQIRRVVVLLENKWEHKHLILDFEGDEIMIYANEELLNQVWINLIANSIKFSYEASTIHIAVAQQDTTVSVSITNHGAVIPRTIWHKIFEKFYQADASRTGDGNGLGLSLAKRIIDLHHGAIFVKESTADKTTFEVQIPTRDRQDKLDSLLQ